MNRKKQRELPWVIRDWLPRANEVLVYQSSYMRGVWYHAAWYDAYEAALKEARNGVRGGI